jgi:hypothetical protein
MLPNTVISLDTFTVGFTSNSINIFSINDVGVGIGTLNPTTLFQVANGNNVISLTDRGNVAITGSLSSNGVIVAGNLSATATITSNTVIANSITSNSMAVSLIVSTVVRDAKGDLRTYPPNDQSSVYVLSTTDIGKVVLIVTNTFVPNAVFQSGDVITLFNNTTTPQTLTMNSSVTTYMANTTNTYSVRRLNSRSLATLLCVAANTFVIGGTGII